MSCFCTLIKTYIHSLTCVLFDNVNRSLQLRSTQIPYRYKIHNLIQSIPHKKYWFNLQCLLTIYKSILFKHLHVLKFGTLISFKNAWAEFWVCINEAKLCSQNNGYFPTIGTYYTHLEIYAKSWFCWGHTPAKNLLCNDTAVLFILQQWHQVHYIIKI